MSSEARLRQILNQQKNRAGGDWIARLQGERTRRLRRLWRRLREQADSEVVECLEALESELEKADEEQLARLWHGQAELSLWLDEASLMEEPQWDDCYPLVEPVEFVERWWREED